MEDSSKELNDQAGDEQTFFVNSEGLKIHCKYWYPQREALR